MEPPKGPRLLVVNVVFKTCNGSVVRHVLNHVKRDIAEIPFVGNAVASAKSGSPVPENVIRKSYAGANRSPARLPELANGAVGHGLNAAVLHLLVKRTA